MQDKPITYVYDGKEVYLTGRVAKPQKTATVSKFPMMVEVVPVGTVEGDTTYSKWVNMKELLIIENLEEQEFD